MLALTPIFILVLLHSLVYAVPQVKLGATTLIGLDVPALKQEFFGGIPYAEPPVGQLRLKPPVLKTSLKGPTFDASRFGAGCLQVVQDPNNTLPLTEDCLTLNVFRPAGVPAQSKLPVLVWIHGGGFLEGAAAQFNGSAIVAQSMTRGTPVIYVNMNYRLGPLGFPQGCEATKKDALNIGLKDQLAGLQWIQENIGCFGGDKDKVTIFGESAGSISIAILFLNVNFGRLARAAIFESGSAATAILKPAVDRETIWQTFIGGVPGCEKTANTNNAFDCLRGASQDALLHGMATALNKSNEDFPWIPTFDDHILPTLPSELIQKGHFARLPFIAGTNLDEGTAFISPNISSTKEVRESLISNFSSSTVNPLDLDASVNKILQLYPDNPALGSPFGTGAQTFNLSSQFKRASAILGDLAFQSQRRAWIQRATECGVKAFGYLFTDPQPNEKHPFLGMQPVPHGTEVLYVYGAVNGSSLAQSLSLNMIDYWVSFATSLDPNDGRGSQRAPWPQYTAAHQVLLQLEGGNTTIIPDNYRSEQIAFINSEPEIWLQRREL